MDRMSFFVKLAKKTITISKFRMIFTPKQASELQKQGIDVRLVPIFQYLCFGKRKLLHHEHCSLTALTDEEETTLDKKRLYIRKSRKDYYPETDMHFVCLNAIVDLLIVGLHKDRVEQLWVRLIAYSNLSRSKLLQLVKRISEYISRNSKRHLLKSLALRGALSLKDRLCDQDIDIILLVRNQSCYEYFRKILLDIAKQIKFRRLIWLEVDFEHKTSVSSIIYYDPYGKYDLDCYMTVGDRELNRIANSDPRVSLWDLGVLRNSKVLLGKKYYEFFVDEYNRLVKARCC
jgi:hypothetical protein